MRRVKASWTPDCSGKQDFDGTLVRVSTRYWPRGGSHSIFQPGVGFVSDGSDPERQRTIPPSAKSILLLDFVTPSGRPGNCVLAEEEFEGETEEEVKAKVEAWVHEHFTRIEAVLKTLFPLAV